MTATNWRAVGRSLLPSWIVKGQEDTGEGARVAHTMLSMFDLMAERALRGIFARFPASAPDDAIAHIGRDRQIRRGFNEPKSSYRVRLPTWWDTWKTAGNPFTLMDQVAAYLHGFAVRIRTVDDRGNWYTREPDGERLWQWDLGNWDWEGFLAGRWSRWWLIIYPLDTGLWETAGDVGDGTTIGGRPGECIGMTATPDQMASIRALCKQWKPAGTRELWTIVAFDELSFDPDGTPEPDGTWKHWTVPDVDDIRVRGRLDTARFSAGTSRLVLGAP